MPGKNRYRTLWWAVLWVLLLVSGAGGGTAVTADYKPSPIVVCTDSYTADSKPPSPGEAGGSSGPGETAENGNAKPGETGTTPGGDKQASAGAAEPGTAKQTAGSEKAHGGATEETPGGPPSSGKKVVWAGDDCGCTPIQPQKAKGKGVITYGFFHKDIALKEDKEKGIWTALIRFSRLNRIGYYSLVYDPVKGFVNYEAWENNPYVRTAVQYNSRVDIVVTFTEGASGLFSDKEKTRVLAGRIERLILNHGGNGVTIDLRGMEGLDAETLEGFFKVLNGKIKAVGGESFVNLLTGFDSTPGQAPFSGLSLKTLAALSQSVDLCLVALTAADDGGDGSGLKEAFLALSKLLDRYGLENDNIEFKDKTLPVLPFQEGDDREIFNQILSVGYGGVGLWPQKSLADDETRFIAEVFEGHPGVDDMDIIRVMVEKYCPGCCKRICPSRVFLVIPAYVLGLLLLIYWVCAFFVCELRTFAATHVRYFVAAVLVFVGLVLSIILCVPFWQGMRNVAAGLLFLGCIGYAVGELIRRRQQARYP